ncbi:amino acid ABC transporter permease [uncultured Dialister sp.]|uniref:amino acid ABC transporter permease n=1 Tax=uncultured Dialister sp. TaxID=278064 RepID=UPI00262CA5E4|nr:amino acid ABC transporter permease [uncultured Dialister sp.]
MIDFSILPTALLFIAKAIPNTLFMAFICLFFGIVLGSVVAVLREQGGRAVNGLFAVLVSFLRGVPAIVQLFIVYNSLPFLLAPVISTILGHTVKPFDVSPYWTVYTTFILYNTAYQSENVRGALKAVDKGQYEAAVSMGMTPFTAFTRIVFPQAFIVALPTFFTYYLKTIKLLALVFTVKVVDMFAEADIFSALYNRRTEPYIADAIAYWTVAILLTFFFSWWEKKLRTKM